jgi:hypothetical protein
VGEDGGVFLLFELGDFLDKIEHGQDPCFLCGAGRTHIRQFNDGLASSRYFHSTIAGPEKTAV